LPEPKKLSPERTAANGEGQLSELDALRSWTFITSHGQILLAVARDPAATVAELAAAAKITERSAYRILADLQQSGYVRRRKLGRHNIYEIDRSMPLRDPTIENELVSDLLNLSGRAEVELHSQSRRVA
jgi:DNA-binding transcriptional ArsR family regulator